MSFFDCTESSYKGLYIASLIAEKQPSANSFLIFCQPLPRCPFGHSDDKKPQPDKQGPRCPPTKVLGALVYDMVESIALPWCYCTAALCPSWARFQSAILSIKRLKGSFSHVRILENNHELDGFLSVLYGALHVSLFSVGNHFIGSEALCYVLCVLGSVLVILGLYILLWGKQLKQGIVERSKPPSGEEEHRDEAKHRCQQQFQGTEKEEEKRWRWGKGENTPSDDKIKEKRSAVHAKLKHEKKVEKRKKLKARDAEEKLSSPSR
ncbi:hypothetical protein D5086_005164 [Populus alba]|uniref:Uncharacterized protein n=1 Tax=Populus alba TaxID=43335 RepID=A0ACC4CSK6_POPAL